MSSASTAPTPGTTFSYLTRLPLGLWIWLKEIRADDLVAGNSCTGIETSASLI
jgi:hypothetical protein